MKVFIILSSIFAIAVANAYYGGGGSEHGGYGHAVVLPTVKVIQSHPVNTGHSSSYRQQDSWGNYKFGYNEQHHDGGSTRDETGDAWGNKEGSYSLNVGDGRHRIVKYVADGHGFRAQIKTNEPGIVAKSPADVSISTAHGHSYAPVGHKVVTPVHYASSYAAPAYASHGYAGNGGGYAGHGWAAPSYGYGSHY